ncbi:hypothetical protein NONI108955_21475 [Nocardia ninae]|uniref:Uncharacterized protein n=1 Tax=Nocardia ninae NBRC 108245 TaxID=1210091 RepID=A0A511M752_9NOCA|nr:hypothetical protein [Nocardia ninae]GEM36460.1 hypothetical protein NN4_09790 [Nocardia ninae NBRC 108245]
MFVKPLLFVSSYAPLFGLLAVRFQTDWLRLSCVVLSVLGICAAVALIRLNAQDQPASYRLVEVSNAGSEASSYLASYLLPFLTVSAPSVSDIAAYVGFLVVAGIVHVKTAVVQINPTLYCLGWSVLKVRDDQGFGSYLLTRQPVAVNTRVLATRWADDILVLRRIEE